MHAVYQTTTKHNFRSYLINSVRYCKHAEIHIKRGPGKGGLHSVLSRLEFLRLFYQSSRQGRTPLKERQVHFTVQVRFKVQFKSARPMA